VTLAATAGDAWLRRARFAALHATRWMTACATLVAILCAEPAGAAIVKRRAAPLPRPHPPREDTRHHGAPAKLTLTSSAFRDHHAIPAKHTCEGADVSPPLAWAGAPAGTRSFALIVDDPDAPDPKAPKMTWVHWVLYDVPPTITSLPEAMRAGRAPRGSRDGTNDWKQPGWRGPCPPIGRHRYFFELYALDRTLGPLRAPTKAAVESAMKGHVLAHATLMGTYEKTR
jgi:Raf kinase inhibitor-like YbhB/YbcL family protein